MFLVYTNNRLLIREMRFEIIVHGCRMPEMRERRERQDKRRRLERVSGDGTAGRLISAWCTSVFDKGGILTAGSQVASAKPQRAIPEGERSDGSDTCQLVLHRERKKRV